MNCCKVGYLISGMQIFYLFYMFLEVAKGAGEGRKSNEADPVGGRISVPERFLSLSKDLSKDLSQGRKGKRGTKLALGEPGSRK